MNNSLEQVHVALLTAVEYHPIKVSRILAKLSSALQTEYTRDQIVERLEQLVQWQYLSKWSRRYSRSYHWFTQPLSDIVESKIKPVKPLRLVQCVFCDALYYYSHSGIKPKQSPCCSNGNRLLSTFPDPPMELQMLIEKRHQYFPTFFRRIVAFNTALKFMSHSIVPDRVGHAGYPCVVINGNLYHRTGALLPPADDDPAFLQCWLYDPISAAQRRQRKCHLHTHAEQTVLRILTEILYDNHALRAVLKHQSEVAAASDYSNYCLALLENRNRSSVYASPVVDEVAVLVEDAESIDYRVHGRDIILHCRENTLRRVNESHMLYDAMAYPILFPFGKPTWNKGMKWNDTSTEVTLLEYYQWHSYHRTSSFNLHLRAGALTQWWICETFLRWEHMKLKFQRKHFTLRRNVPASILDDSSFRPSELKHSGKSVVLGPSHVGSPRYYNKRIKEGYAYAAAFGKPDLFITMTMNEQWIELAHRLEGDPPTNHPFIVSQIFKEKINQLMSLLNDYGVFGKVIAYMYTIEWQKRLLPHVHLLLWLHPSQKIVSQFQVDRIISARIPDPETHPILYELVTHYMLHRKCGIHGTYTKCLDASGHCSSFFPKPYANETRISRSSYPTYHRVHPQCGAHQWFDNHGNQYTDAWVVPYNPMLLYIFKCHINVEACMSVQGIKYINKYINKGNQQIQFKIMNSADEVTAYDSARYINAMEAAWRMLGNVYNYKHPAVYLLDVHLPNSQKILFDPDETDIEEFNKKIASKTTTLLQWFKLNTRESEESQSESWPAKELLYSETVKYYSYSNSQGWVRRKHIRDTISRMHPIVPNQGEIFFLRMVLGHARGARNWDDLYTFNGQRYNSFEEVCYARGILAENDEWISVLREVATERTSVAGLRMFASLILSHPEIHALQIWDELESEFLRDYFNRRRRQRRPEDIDLCKQQALFDLNSMLMEGNMSIADIGFNDRFSEVNPLIAEHILTEAQVTSYRQRFQQRYESLTEEQREVLDSIINSNCSTHVIKAMGGSGKTYLEETLIFYWRSQNKIVLPMASTGIAASLIENSRTVHSSFKVPINTDGFSRCNFSATNNRNVTELLRRTDVFIVDEAFTLSKYVWQCVDQSLRTELESDRLFAGKTVILIGDTQQTSVIVPKGDETDIFNHSIQKFYGWKSFERNTHRLTTNMRIVLQTHEIEEERAMEWDRFLKQIGSDEIERFPQIHPNAVEIPRNLIVESQDLNELIDFVYPQFEQRHNQPNYLNERAILTPLNRNSFRINEMLNDRIQAESRSLYSSDAFLNDEDNLMWSMEFLHNNRFPGIPEHELKLKVGSVVLCMRNINPAIGLRNGTKMRVIGFLHYSVECEILSGAFVGTIVQVPRIDFHSKLGTHPVEFSRRQYPLQLAFCMTINKSQGQTLQTCGIYLPAPVFSHGQLYTALSRCGNSNNIRMIIEQTKNQGKFFFNADYKWITINVVQQNLL